VGRNRNKIDKVISRILAKKAKVGESPEFWDGKTAERIAKIIVEA
jgi:uncharacterized protein YkvS